MVKSKLERCRAVVRAASAAWSALESNPAATAEQVAAARGAWKTAQDAFNRAYMDEHKEEQHLRAALGRALPGWSFFRFRRHSSYTRGPDGEYPMLGDDGRPITVNGWVVDARNPHGRTIYSHAFDQVEDIVPYLSRYAEMS